MTDPDAPSRSDPKWSEYCHWIITGLRAKNDRAPPIDVNKAFQVLDYMGPGPPPKTGKHRYVFLLYKGGNLDKMEPPHERKKWGNEEYRQGARKWAKHYGLELVGEFFYSSRPGRNILTVTGANFFYAQNKEQ